MLKITKTKFRNRLSNPMLNSLMQTSINGPQVDECKTLVSEAVSSWLSAKKRRKLNKEYKLKEISGQSDAQNTTEEQFEDEPQIVLEIENVEEKNEREIEQVEEICHKLGLGSESEVDSDSSYDSDCEKEDETELELEYEF